MTREETKKKIYEIVLIELQNQFGCGDTVEVGDREVCADAVADALIAAGIGDVEEAEHREEVAERALKSLAIKYVENLGYPPEDVNILAGEITVSGFLRQAEKELAEENGGKKEV